MQLQQLQLMQQHVAPSQIHKKVIDISSIEQNLRALVVFYPIPLIMPHDKVGKDGGKGEPIDTTYLIMKRTLNKKIV